MYSQTTRHSNPWMPADRQVYWFTSAISEHRPLFGDHPLLAFEVINTLNHIFVNKAVNILAFVIMRDHVHVVWDLPADLAPKVVKHSFFSYLGRHFSKYLIQFNPEYLSQFKSILKDREHRFWKTTSRMIPINSTKIICQKIHYTHMNPVRADYYKTEMPEDHLLSSASSYKNELIQFPFVKLYKPYTIALRSGDYH